MTHEEVQPALLQGLRRLQDRDGERFPLNMVLCTRWLQTNGIKRVVGWGKMQVRDMTSQQAFLLLLRHNNRVLYTFPNKHTAKCRDLRNPSPVALDQANAVEVTR